MRIIKCSITDFGCYSNKAFDFCTGLNRYCLKNGEGKTTLAAFIKAMFYSLEKTSKSSFERKRYKPYSGRACAGSMEIELSGENYRIEREFGESPAKDTLKIYNSHGTPLNSFMSKPVSQFQGEGGKLLGELILGIDEEAFKRCNFISSSDLDFSASESIKMKIGNIVIDRERENPYEEVINSIKSFDLREKKPTKKNENAYPYMVKALTKKNKDRCTEILELDELSKNLDGLYEKRNKLADAVKEISEKQKEYAKINVQKGKLSTVNEFDSEIKKQTKAIDEITAKYHGSIPSKEEVDSLKSYIDECDKCENLEKSFSINASDIEKLKELEGKVPTDEEYEDLLSASTKLKENSKGTGLVNIDTNRYDELKAKFEGRKSSIKDEQTLQKEYFEYISLGNAVKSHDGETHQSPKNLPSENVLKQIEADVSKYNQADNELAALKNSYKEPSMGIKILLIIITLGIYAFVLKSKAKAHEAKVGEKEAELKKIAYGLDAFFSKYDKSSGSYELRIEELKDEVGRQESAESKIAEEQLKGIQENLEKKRQALLLYFSIFGYATLNVDEAYSAYKKDLADYNGLLKDVERNKDIKAELAKSNGETNALISSTLAKYGLTKKEDFANQLSKIKADIEFYKRSKPIYTNKVSNGEHKKSFESKIVAILSSHNIDHTSNPILKAKEVIADVEAYSKAKENRVESQDKKAKFIKDNGLEGFVASEIEADEEKLRREREQKSAELSTLEDQIEQNENSIQKKDTIQNEIAENNEKIAEYNERIRIAKLAEKALEEAHAEMEETFIDPIKNSFVHYANQIHEKIGANVVMDYDYDIKYDVGGQLRESKGLSNGERAIMMLALRFAILDSMYENHDSIIILDDPFESLDAEKLPRAIELLRTLSNDWQIVYFTCHESREIA